MLRYYKQIGHVRPALRTYSGYRVDSEKDVATLRFVRRARSDMFRNWSADVDRHAPAPGPALQGKRPAGLSNPDDPERG
jgi:hypothetical protein